MSGIFVRHSWDKRADLFGVLQYGRWRCPSLDDRPPVPFAAGSIHGFRILWVRSRYIGNAPNFMVKAIAEQRGVPMPSFFGYMAWSVIVLVPLFALHTMIFFVWQLFKLRGRLKLRWPFIFSYIIKHSV